MTTPDHRCECDPCTLPRAKGGRCPDTGDVSDGVVSSHCIACAFQCLEDDE